MKLAAYRIILLILLSLPNSHLIADDFRGANFGDHCGNEIAYELKAGSKLTSESSYSGNDYEGMHLGYLSHVFYNCDGNQSFNRGVVFYHFPSTEEAKNFFSTARSLLIRDYGSTKMDVDSPQNIELMANLGLPGKEIMKYSALWKTETTQILLSISFPSKSSPLSTVGLNYSPINNRP